MILLIPEVIIQRLLIIIPYPMQRAFDRFVNFVYIIQRAFDRFVVVNLIIKRAFDRFVVACIFVLPLFLMCWRTSYRASVREAAILGGMRWRSLDLSRGDPRRSDRVIPYCIDLDVFVSIVFCLI